MGIYLIPAGSLGLGWRWLRLPGGASGPGVWTGLPGEADEEGRPVTTERPPHAPERCGPVEHRRHADNDPQLDRHAGARAPSGADAGSAVDAVSLDRSG